MIPIKLIIQPGEKPIETEVKECITIEEVVKQYQEKLPYRVLAAKVNNRVRELTRSITEPCTITFLDMRDATASRIYQNSVSFIYLKAINDLLGNVRVEIQNSLNKGIYTEIKTREALSVDDVSKIEDKMRELVQADIPFVRKILSREEAFKLFSDHNHEEKRRILKGLPHVDKVPVYSCDGFLNFFYGQMVPSTGYIEYFELRRYRNGVILRFPEPAAPDRIPEFRNEAKLYRAFGEAKKWGNLMGISYVEDLNQAIATGEYKEIIQISEALHEKKIAYIADDIVQKKKRIILICGPSSSGKTSFAKRLIIQLRVHGEKPLYIGTDDYFVERHQTPLLPDGTPNFEDIEALDLSLFNRNMNDLLSGKEVDLPVFDFYTGRKQFGTRITKISADQPIIIEGIHVLNRILTAEIDDESKYKIYISPLTQLNIDNHNRIPTTDARLLRRMVRDHQFRGYDANKTLEQWPKVRAGEDKNIFPFNGEADMLFNSAHIYELGVLKKYAEPMLEAIGPEEATYSEAVRLLRFLRYFHTIEDDSVIPNNSIIREFIGGSILV
ncbi:MAG: nucleoside kinase [Anaerovoracaceae bacterium]